MSSFGIGGTIVTFDLIDTSFKDTGGPLEEFVCTILVANATDWGALFSLRSWQVTQRVIPGGNIVYVDIGGGAGVGSLVLDNLSTHSAVMTALSRTYVEPGTLRSLAQATWLITA